MGCVKTITKDKFPRQGKHLNKRVDVCFHYNTEETIDGLVVRDDVEIPFVTIIRLAGGKYVLDTECQYSLE